MEPVRLLSAVPPRRSALTLSRVSKRRARGQSRVGRLPHVGHGEDRLLICSLQSVQCGYVEETRASVQFSSPLTVRKPRERPLPTHGTGR
ncbi:hypothetical protein AAFF_G00146970 [Aldrovandia affinis]|uniref:Uncharacterized protein n=1 Tax=Aldrovandia affinis TaxID=143900 RepID=A0AAD7W9R2_9TELE|nr:hypothetical protein AAFF_G00146970 [Aldrovandia affinis]